VAALLISERRVERSFVAMRIRRRPSIAGAGGRVAIERQSQRRGSDGAGEAVWATRRRPCSSVCRHRSSRIRSLRVGVRPGGAPAGQAWPALWIIHCSSAATIGVGAAVAAVRSHAGNGDESSPSAAWRSASLAPSDRISVNGTSNDSGRSSAAALSGAHGGSTTVTPIAPHAGSTTISPIDQHRSSTTLTPIDHARSSTTISPIDPASGSSGMSGKPVGPAVTGADHATKALSADEALSSLPGWSTEKRPITRTDPTQARGEFGKSGGPRETFIKRPRTEPSRPVGCRGNIR
jgi:hypothetical protein